MPLCAVVDCPSRQFAGCGKTFHLFPLSRPDILKQWLANMKRELWTPSKRSVLCSDHFENSCFDNTGSTTRIRTLAVPTLFSSPEEQNTIYGGKRQDKRTKPKESHLSPKKSTKADETLHLSQTELKNVKVTSHLSSTKLTNAKESSHLSSTELTGAKESSHLSSTKSTNAKNSHLSTAKSTSTKESNGVKLDDKFESGAVTPFPEVRSSKRIPKRKHFDPDFEYNFETQSKSPRLKLQDDQAHLRRRVPAERHCRTSGKLSCSSASKESLEESSVISDISLDSSREEECNDEKNAEVTSIKKEKDDTGSAEHKREDMEASPSIVEVKSVDRPSERITKERDDGEQLTSIQHKITSKDKVTHLPNNFIHFEFATARRQVILELENKVKNSGLRSETLQDLLGSLKDKGLLTKEAEELIGAFGELPKGLIRLNRKKGLESVPYGRCLEEVKEFATVLFINSPVAYDLVREIFMLPNPSVIRARLQVEDYWPGFTKEALRILSKDVCRTVHDRLCCVMFDSISIKEECSFDDSSGKWIGHIDLGSGQNPGDSDEILPANELLVFSAVGLGSNWKLPFGYFLSRGLSSEFLKNLVTEAILIVEEHGLNVRAVVCNCSSLNIKMGNCLGCNIHPRVSSEMVTSFPHPLNQERKIHLVFGIRQMLQLLEKLLVDKGTLQSSVYGQIEWKNVSRLTSCSKRRKRECLFILNPDHMKFCHHLRTIRKSGAVFNSRLSYTLQTANKFDAEFDKCSSTANFVADVQRAFDLLNSRNPISSEDRPPVHWATLLEQMESFTNVADRILGLELSSGKLIARDGRWMSVVLFGFTLESVSRLAAELLNENCLQYFNTYRVNVDHIDMILSHLQRHGCWSDVPSAAAFRDAYKNLFVKSPKNLFYYYDFEGEALTVGQGDIYSFRHYFRNSSDHNSNGLFLHSTNLIDLSVDEENRANCIIQWVVQQLSCPDCLDMILDDDLLQASTNVMVNIDAVRPSRFLLRLLKKSETVLRVELAKSKSIIVEQLVLCVSSEYFSPWESRDISELCKGHFMEEPYHVICLVKVIIRTLICLRVRGRKNFWN